MFINPSFTWKASYIITTVYSSLWVAVQIRVICYSLLQGAAVAIARGCGQCLNFNPTFIIILMMRRALTWLRSTRIAFLFPLDQHIELHKLCGTMILIYSLVHTLAHLINLSKTLFIILCSTQLLHDLELLYLVKKLHYPRLLACFVF